MGDNLISKPHPVRLSLNLSNPHGPPKTGGSAATNGAVPMCITGHDSLTSLRLLGSGYHGLFPLHIQHFNFLLKSIVAGGVPVNKGRVLYSRRSCRCVCPILLLLYLPRLQHFGSGCGTRTHRRKFMRLPYPPGHFPATETYSLVAVAVVRGAKIKSKSFFPTRN